MDLARRGGRGHRELEGRVLFVLRHHAIEGGHGCCAQRGRDDCLRVRHQLPCLRDVRYLRVRGSGLWGCSVCFWSFEGSVVLGVGEGVWGLRLGVLSFGVGS